MNKAAIFIVAIVIALLLTLIFHSAKQPSPIQVLAAKTQLKAGTRIQKSDLVWKKIPENYLKPGFIKNKSDIHQVIGAEVVSSIGKHHPLDKANLRLLAGGYIAKILSPGHVAIAIVLPSKIAISNLFQSGDRVNIMLTRTVGAKGALSRVVLKNLEILAIAPDEAKKSDKKQKASTIKTMVLSMNQEQVNIYNVASTLGKLSYVLKSARTGKSVRALGEDQYVTSSEVKTTNPRNTVNLIHGSGAKTEMINP